MRTIDQIRASKLPSNMMQFAARGALSVPPDENLEILVYLATHNKIFGDLARMTLAGWDEKASLAAASDAKTSREVLDYFIARDNLRPKLLPALLENFSVAEGEIAKLALGVPRESIETMMRSPRVKASALILDSLRANPYLRPEEGATLAISRKGESAPEDSTPSEPSKSEMAPAPESEAAAKELPSAPQALSQPVLEGAAGSGDEADDIPEQVVAAYVAEHAAEIDAEGDKPFQPVGGILDLLGTDYFPVSQVMEISEIGAPEAGAALSSSTLPASDSAPPANAILPARPPARRENSMQKINRLDVKGRIQLALKGNKEERSILIRDGTKVVALAVLEAPKISDGEVEKFALQKNVLEAVLRHIPLKRRFMKNYIVVRNLVSNPRTPLDLGLGLMKHLLTQDLKNISANKEVSETVRSLALKMYKQKLDAANKK